MQAQREIRTSPDWSSERKAAWSLAPAQAHYDYGERGKRYDYETKSESVTVPNAPTRPRAVARENTSYRRENKLAASECGSFHHMP